MTRSTTVQINGERLWSELESLAKIGALPGGGVCRLAFSKEDKQGRDYVEQRMRDAGLEVRIDPIGNILGVRDGTGPDRRLVLTGSHIDTVGTGGKYDGSLGVLAGLEVLQTLNEHQVQTHHAVGVVAFVNEEGVRFMPDMMGSLYVSGQLGLDEIEPIEGIDGKTIKECLDEVAFSGEDDIPVDFIKSFIELHIEQGPVLLDKELDIGIVDRVQGILWEEVVLEGESNHAGVTPMHRRRDAGYVASSIAAYVRTLTEEIEGLRGTVGALSLFPNLINVIAKEATMTIDLRHAEKDQLIQARDLLHQKINALCEKEKVRPSIKPLADVDPVIFDAQCVESVEKAAEALHYSSMRMISGAGHDAQIMASKWPASMIFIPSQDGISHNINEYSTPEHVEAGANVLLHAILDKAGMSTL